MSKFVGSGQTKVKAAVERIGPLRAYQKICIAVIKLLDDYKTKNERYNNLPAASDERIKKTAVTLDAIQLTGRDAIREQVMKELEKDFISVRKDLARRGYSSQVGDIQMDD